MQIEIDKQNKTETKRRVYKQALMNVAKCKKTNQLIGYE